QSAKRVLVCGMELGGNAPFVVFDGADIEAAADAALIAKMRNGGASCIAANRIYVQESAKPAFLEAFLERMEGLSMGPGLAAATTRGPLVPQRGRARVAAAVAAAVERGAKVLCGGETPDRNGFYYPATVLDEVASGDPILDEEIFGPVAPIVSFSGFDEVVR